MSVVVGIEMCVKPLIIEYYYIINGYYLDTNSVFNGNITHISSPVKNTSLDLKNIFAAVADIRVFLI